MKFIPLMVLSAITLSAQSSPDKPRVCSASLVSAETSSIPVWHIKMTDTTGHSFIVIQTDRHIDKVFTTCKEWLKNGKRKKFRNPQMQMH